MRDRLIIAKELLTESGSCFLQISDENVHLVRNVMDEVFGSENFCNMISFQKTGSIASNGLGTTVDYIIWYSKDKSKLKYRQLYLPRKAGHPSLDRYEYVELPDGKIFKLTVEYIRGEKEIPEGKRFGYTPLISDGASKENKPFVFNGETFYAPKNKHWKTDPSIGGERLIRNGRIAKVGNQLWYKRYVDDFPMLPINDRVS